MTDKQVLPKDVMSEQATTVTELPTANVSPDDDGPGD